VLSLQVDAARVCAPLPKRVVVTPAAQR
jgi:hypothetical protein